MRKAEVVLILGTFLLWALIVPAQAQQGLQLRVDSKEIGAGEFPEITIPLAVRDSAGVPVYDLGADNFQVTEDGSARTRPILSLETKASSDIQTSVILALDVSGSMEGAPLADAKAAASGFLDRLGEDDRTALIAFGGKLPLDGPLDPTHEVGFSNVKAKARALLDSLEAEGITPLYDAVFKAARLASKEPAGNRAVLLLTDGRDETGAGGPGSAVANEDSPIREANRSNIPVFVIGLGEGIDRAYLQRLAMETGGTYQEAPDSQELSALFQNVADLLKQQYVLTYESGLPGDGKLHRVSVRLELSGRVADDEVTFGPLPLTVTVVPTAIPTRTPTPASTPTAVPTATPTSTPKTTPTDTPTPMPTNTLKATPTHTATATPTHTSTSTVTHTPTATPNLVATTTAEARARETAIAATLTAQPTATAMVVVITKPTKTRAPTSTPVPTPTPTPKPVVKIGPVELGASGILALAGIVILVLAGGGTLAMSSRRRRAEALAEYCRNCGHRLTEPGSCPQCGDTHRLRKPKA